MLRVFALQRVDMFRLARHAEHLLHLLHLLRLLNSDKELKMNSLAHSQLPPSPRDAVLARASSQLLSGYLKHKRPLALHLKDAGPESPFELPARALVLLVDILDAMAAGRSVTVLPESAELTTVEAASVLHVSRPFLIKLLNEGAIPHRKVGKHRRIRLEDAMAYKCAVDREREAVLDQLAQDAQHEGMGYPRR